MNKKTATDRHPAAGKKARAKAKGHAARNAVFIILGVTIVAIAVAAMPYFLSQNAGAAIIKIPEYAKAENVKDSLAKYYGKDFATRTMRLFSSVEKNPASRHGAYEIPEGASPFQAARILARGAQYTVKVTINGVRQFDPFIDRIAAKFNFPAADLRALLNDPATLRPYGLTPEQAPSLFFNDTYYLYWTATPADVVKKVGENYLKFWNDDRRRKAAELGLTPAEVMTVASIVDEETNQISEKGRIGRLYINRLKKGMRLQADPTVKFALGDFSIRRITSQHLSAPGPYNTYRVKGLPPGPIRTTSTATVQAILDSSPSDDIYMCAKEDFSGFHNFASDYDTHLRNARRYQEALDRRGIE